MGNKIIELIKNNQIKRVDKDTNFKFSCKQCGGCCTNRINEEAIILSPYDVFRIAKGLGKEPQDVLQEYAEFTVGHTSYLPIPLLQNKKLSNGSTQCILQNENKCSVQAYKPDVCRMFPLGRTLCINDDEPKIEYFLQNIECAGKFTTPNDVHKLDDWIPNRQESEQAFAKFSEFVQEYRDTTMKLILDNENISDELKNKLLSATIDIMYTNYDTSQDFLEQFDRNRNTWLGIQHTIDNKYRELLDLEQNIEQENEFEEENELQHRNSHKWR